MERANLLFLTWFGSGRLPKMPGTWGSLASLPFAYLLLKCCGLTIFIYTIALFFFLGWLGSFFHLKNTPSKDPKYIVIDEVVGQWIALIPCAFSPVYWLAAFLLFRFFDIFKIFPCNWVEDTLQGSRFLSSLAIMLDDVIAGLYALLVIVLISFML